MHLLILTKYVRHTTLYESFQVYVCTSTSITQNMYNVLSFSLTIILYKADTFLNDHRDVCWGELLVF